VITKKKEFEHQTKAFSEVVSFSREYIEQVTESIQARINREQDIEKCYFSTLESCDELITEFKRACR
jgi:hypothetical protein